MILVEAKEQPCYALRDRLAAISTLPAVPERAGCQRGWHQQPPFSTGKHPYMPGGSQTQIIPPLPKTRQFEEVN